MIKFIKARILAFIMTMIFFAISSQNALAIELAEAINLANSQSTEIKIEEQKSDLANVGKFDAVTMFLPNISASYRTGKRKTQISSNESNKLDEQTKSIELNQPIFNGFQGIYRVKEANARSNLAKEELQAKKNDIALAVAESYLNIWKLRQIIKIENEQILNYKKLVGLAKQRLKFKDISYIEYNDYETRNQNLLIQANNNKLALIEAELSFEKLVKQKPENLVKPQIKEDLEDVETILDLAKKNNPKIQSSNLNLKATKAAAMAQKGKILPKASLLLSKEKQKSSYYFNGSSVDNEAIYFDVSIPIFQAGTEYSAIIKSSTERKIANLENKLTLEEVEKQIKEGYSKFNLAKENLKTSGEILQNSIESLALIEDRFKKKDIGQMDLLLKKIDIVEMEKQNLIIESDMLNNYFKLKALINDIL